MASGGYLIPSSQNHEQTRLWDETWKRLERFLPGMFAEIFPESRVGPAQRTVTVEATAEMPRCKDAAANPEAK
jgi:brefeldin A-resistance guanine nucleotide exchange factor 1